MCLLMFYVDGLMSVWYVFFGYFGCMGVIVVIFFDMYMKFKFDLIVFGLEVSFVLLGFVLVGLLGMFFF